MTLIKDHTTFEVADFRRKVFALYAQVRDYPDPRAGHTLWRNERDKLFKHHPASALTPEDRSTFTGLPIAPYDPAWRFEVQLESSSPRNFDFPTESDGVVPFELIGVAHIPNIGKLDVWRLKTYGGGIFLPVRDSLAGQRDGTYGGGRYVLDTIKGADLGSGPAAGSLVIDFNFAYNPSCAYNPAFSCPLPPEGNRVKVEIPVGELYQGSH